MRLPCFRKRMSGPGLGSTHLVDVYLYLPLDMAPPRASLSRPRLLLVLARRRLREAAAVIPMPGGARDWFGDCLCVDCANSPYVG